MTARQTRGRGSRILAAAVVFEALTLTAAATWWPIYESAPFVLLALVTVTVGVAIGAAGALWSWPSYVVLGAGVAAWLLLGVPLAVPSKAVAGVLPTGSGLADLVVTTAAGWRQLLTIAVPVGDYQALLVPVFVLLLVTSILGVTVATRSAHPAVAVVFPAVVLVAGIVLGATAPAAPVAVGALFAVGVVVWLLVVRGRVNARRLAAAGGVVVVGLVVAGAVAVVVPAPDRVVARDFVAQPFDPSDYASPLSGFRAFLKAPDDDAVMLSVGGPAAAPGVRIVIARMNDYDGVVFDVGGASDAAALFSRVPGRLDEVGAASGGPLTDAVFRIGSYEGVWVPTTGDPVAIEFDASLTDGAAADPARADAADPARADALQNSLFYSPALATAADTAALGPGDAYTVTTRRPAAPDDLLGLTPATPSATPPPAAPPAVANRLAQWAPESLSPGERLGGIVDGLQQGYRSSGGEGEVFSRSGHGADRIQELLTATPMLGDDEQYAVAGALLAEAAGFPARVAMGFTVPDAAADDSGLIEVHGRDAAAWVEVDTAEAGWVALDVTPAPGPVPQSAIDDASTAVQPPEVIPPVADEPDDPVDSAPLQQNDEKPPASNDTLAAVLRVALLAGISLAAIAVVLAPFGVILALKRRRRVRRRTRGTPRSRAAGGWAEVLDAAADAAADTEAIPPPNATRREAAQSLGGGSATLLAQRVDGALYSPAEPSERDLADIWAASDAERRRLLERRGRIARLLARVSTRSLRTYHGRNTRGRNYR
ncbi:transglutaminase-like domain-containing protein [Herbiconiux daphne]|uniref:Transglutaminase-like domain-containing protein n=1 Tax=Herbiconiux daphne TaxID=2970914 RepID=A0ABT2H0Z7_9MICO|nr:transglutaminase-like domain-containing protein [Herbiconiux daphne]MCS5733605.1 transglutaminase-like domain-containing protein [Herbiconiux daphne]